MKKLYEEFTHGQIPSGLPMVALISGFSDSGSTIAQLSDNFFSETFIHRGYFLNFSA